MNKPDSSKRKKLPIGIQTFSHIRGEDYYYVDKTAYALRLANKGKYYFLSRPRRFGKSLFLDTLAELFAGNESLFRGLYCHDKWDWTIKHPVIRLSFGSGRIERREQLEQRIFDLLRINREKLGLECPDHLDIPGCLGELIRAASSKYGQHAVILVDEYDKPILDNLTNPDLARVMREGLRNLYSAIKDNDAHIRFAFLTGVSRFSKVNIFSGLNNLNDITLDKDYSAICGYTEEDLDAVFAPELEGLDRQQIQAWYNGYNWTGEAVYNPFDLLLLFDKREIRPYWFETGTPTFLIDVLTERRVYLPALVDGIANESLLSSFDIGNFSVEALMFQAGYLTIAGVHYRGVQPRYRLDFPNLEVQASLSDALLARISPDHGAVVKRTDHLYEYLLTNDFAAMEQLFVSLFASIPHQWYTKNPMANYEGYYASVFYSHFAALGLEIVVEDATNLGRIDMTLLFNGQVYLFEFKVVDSEEEARAGQRALAQLKDKNYAAKYQSRKEPIHLIGVEFSRETRSVVGFALEHL